MMPAPLGWGCFGHVGGWSLGKGEEGCPGHPEHPWGCSGCLGYISSPHDVFTQGRHLLELCGSTCMENLGCESRTPPYRGCILAGGHLPLRSPALSQPTAVMGGCLTFLDAWVSVPSALLFTVWGWEGG